MPESTPTPGSGVQPGAGRPPGRPRIGPVALVVGILAVVIVLGVATGLIVMVLRGGPGGPVSPPGATVTPEGPTTEAPTP
ncbi:MAG: hypothetical protein L0G99_11680, partial [Propionibacteriales bacterium]|nr:hypothetical protein [Propionibacteriales bacterium]